MTDPNAAWVVTIQVERPDGSSAVWVADNAEDEATAMAEADILRLAYHGSMGVYPTRLEDTKAPNPDPIVRMYEEAFEGA